MVSRPSCGRSGSSSRSVPGCRAWTVRGTSSRGATSVTSRVSRLVASGPWIGPHGRTRRSTCRNPRRCTRRSRRSGTRPGVLVRAAWLPDRPVGALQVGAPAIRRQQSRAVLQPVRVRDRRRQRPIDGRAPAPRMGAADDPGGEPQPGGDAADDRPRQALHGRPELREPDDLGSSSPWRDPQRLDEGVAPQPGAEPQAAHRRDRRRVHCRDRPGCGDRFRHDRRAHPGSVDDRV